jgi:hypothetical protein
MNAPRAKRKWGIDPYPGEDGRWHIPEDEWQDAMETIRLAGQYLGGGFVVMPVRVKLPNGEFETRGWRFSWENAPAVEEEKWENYMEAKYRAAQNGHSPQPEEVEGESEFPADELLPEPVSGD